MKEKAEQLILDFELKGWQTENLYKRFFELTEDSNSLYIFAEKFLENFSNGATILNDSLSYLDEKQFEKLIEISLEILKETRNENAESVIEYASLQFPKLLHNHLQTIFELKPNESTYYAQYPWRNLERSKIEFWKDKFTDTETSVRDRGKLLNCLLESRDLKTIGFVCDYVLTNNLLDKSYLTSYLELVGLTLKNDEILSYCPNRLKHFSFPKNYLPEGEALHLSKERHPTWRLAAEQTEYKIGGVIQEDESNPFFHLITFEQIPDGLNITKFNRLVLGVHTRELNGYGEIFYQHFEKGNLQKFSPDKENKIEIYDDDAIRETFVSFAPTPDRWQFQSWGSSNGRENLFRLGGEPTWIQSAEVLICPKCEEKMDFLMQLDSELPDTENQSVMFGSGGICYVFWCDSDGISGYMMQCT